MKRRLIHIILIILTVSFQYQTFAQQIDSTQAVSLQKNSSIFNKKNIIIAAIVAQQIGSFYVEYQWWWKGDYHPFVIESDGWFNNYSLGIDKCGHFYTSYLYFNLINELLKWGEFSDRTRLITSIAIPFAYALSIEIGDGFSSYNFSPSDLTANSLGICYGLLQDRVPFMQNFNVKFSYFPSSTYFNNNFEHWKLTSDYDGHIYWLSMNAHNLLPQKLQNGYPKFLNIALGYGIQNFGSTLPLQREFFIGVDYNLGAIKTKNKTMKSIICILDKIHYPAPGIKKIEGENLVPKWIILN